MVTCPICGVSLPNFSGHGKHHGIDTSVLHALRLEADYGRPIADLLTEIYVVKRLASTQIFAQYGITFRMLRRLLAAHSIPMRDRSEAVTATWEKDDGARSQATSEKLKETRAALNFVGDNHPNKRPEVRRKISEAKRRSNPGLDLMQAHVRRAHEENTIIITCKNCGEPFEVKQSRDFQMFCSMKCCLLHRGPTSIETTMSEALTQANIQATEQHRLGKYILDFALVKYQIAIECDGIHWHDADRDALRDAILASKGWLTFRYTDTQIETDIDACIQDLITRLNELGIDPTATQ